MAVVIGAQYEKNLGGMNALFIEAQVTGATTFTFNLPAGTRLKANTFINRTTGAINPTGATYVESSGVWTSPTMVANDFCTVMFLLD